MRRVLAAAAALATLFASPALAALKLGDKAPDFATQGALAGKPFPFKMSEALRKGPVVLYFFPAAFTTGCTIEAHEFAEASDDFTKLGATVIGVTAGNVDRVSEFSVSECRNKFAVAADPKLAIAKSYDSTLPLMGLSNRTSYVIAPSGEVIYVLSDLKGQGHARGALAALKTWRASHPK